MPSFALLQQFRPMGRKYPDGLAEIRQTEGSKTNETMAAINENLKKQLAKKMYHFVKYFPVRIRNVGEDAIENRKLVWGFKDADREITLKVARMTASYLLNEFGDRVKNIVFVCIPASTYEQNENRYRFFCEQVCSLAGVVNGFSHIRLLADRPSVHENRKKKTHADFSDQSVKFDEDFFKEKDVLIYDDVVTTGTSYAELADRLEFFGANVLGGLFLGKTFYRYN
ncbi:ribonucleotide-diphosphate reductase subunit alpha [Phocaeicola vulgatus]|nr:ribonucleotide-diphosphate reductase subunit alpha [Phocaeicola vulgatus]